MKKIVLKWVLSLMIVVLGCVCKINVRAETHSVGTFNDLMNALSYAQSSDVIEISGYIEIPVQTDMGYDHKLITIKRKDEGSYLFFNYNASGSTVKNIIFEGDGVAANNSIVCTAQSLTFDNCTFQNCITSFDGGAVAVDDGSVSFNKCIFKDGEAARGGAVAIHNGSSILFNECSFTGNKVTQKGGAVVVNSASPNVVFEKCTISGNEAVHGGGISASGNISIKNCMIRDNKAALKGNDLYIDEFGRLTVNNTNEELKALYEADTLIYEGIYDEEDESAALDILNIITGEKGLIIKYSEKEDEPESEPTTSPDENVDDKENSTVTPVTNNYNQSYNPVINNTVTVPVETESGHTPEKQQDVSTLETVETTATIDDGVKSVTYETKPDESGNSTLEISDGTNTITININVGTDEAAASVDAVENVSQEKLYRQNNIGWVDIVELLFLGIIVIYLIKNYAKQNENK